MFLPVETDVLTSLRRQFHRTKVFLSVMDAPVLWEARINDALIVLGETSIDFDGGSGSFYSYVEALQEVWVGSTAGDDDIGRLRIKSITSGDGGITGTLTVSGHSLSLNDDQYLTFKHDYPLKPKWSYVDVSEIFYMDDDITYTDQNEDLLPVVIAGPHMANKLFNGTVSFRLDASRSYAMTPGAVISSYSIQVRSTSGVVSTANFSTTTGAGFITMTLPGVYWVKYTVTDDGARSASSYRCYIVESDSAQAVTSFQNASVDGDWKRGGWEATIKLDDEFDLATVPDYALAILWYEPIWDDVIGRGTQIIAGNVGPTGDKVVFHNPRVYYTPTGGGDMDLTFKTRLTIYGDAPAAGYSTSWNVTVSGCGTTPVVEVTTANGYLEINLTVNSCNTTGTIVFTFNGADIVTWPYDQDDPSDPLIETYSLTDIGHKNLMVGYVMKDQEEKDTSTGIEKDEIYIATVEKMLSKFAFSMSLISISGTPAYWYEGPSWQTMGTILQHWWMWRSTLFETTDVFDLNAFPLTLQRAMGAFDAGNLYDAANEFVEEKGVRCKVISDRMGRLFVTPDHNLLRDSERSSLVNAFEIRRADRGGVISRSREPINRSPFVDVSGFSWDGSFNADGTAAAVAHCAIAPGGKPDWDGSDPISKDFQTFEDAAHARAIAGRLFATVNNTYPETRIEFVGNYAGVVEIAYPICWTIDIQNTDLPKGIAWVDKRLYCRNVSINFTSETGMMTVNAAFEADAPGFDGVTTECPSFPTTGGEVPDIPPEDDSGGALVTGSSVYYLPPGAGETWEQRVSQTVLDLIADPWWHIKTGSAASKDGIMFRCGVGYIRRTTDAWDTTDVDVTPGSDPPNTAGDSPAPTVANVSFEMIEADWQDQDAFAAMATWQNSGGQWRTWLWVSDDNMATGSWIALEAAAAAVDSYGTTTQFESNTTYINIAAGGGQSAAKPLAVLDSSHFVVMYYDYDNTELRARLGTVVAGVISYGSPVTIFAGSVQEHKIVALDNDQLAVVFYDDTLGSTLKVVAGQVSGATLSFGSPATVSSAAETDANICKLTNASALIAYTKQGTPQTGQAVVVSIAGTAVGAIGGEEQWRGSYADGIDCVALSGNHIVVVFRGTSNRLMAIAGTISGTSVVWGSETFLSAATANMASIKALSSSKIVVSYENSGGGLSAVVAGVVTYTVTPGSEYSIEATNIFTNGNIIVANSTTVFFTYSSYAGSLYGGYTMPATVGGTIISTGTRSLDVDTATNIPIWYGSEKLTSTQCVTVYESNASTGESFLFYTDFGQIRGLGIVYSKLASANLFWLTGWDGTDLILQKWDLPLAGPTASYSLGPASEAEVDDRTWIAFPFAPFWTGDVFVFGRMDNPQGLGSPAHVLQFDGSTFSLVEDSYSGDHVGSMYVNINTDDIILIRNRASGDAKIYAGVLGGAITARGTIPGSTWIGKPRGMAIFRQNGNLYLGSGSASGIMVLCTYQPYINFINLTFNHSTANGIVAVEIL